MEKYNFEDIKDRVVVITGSGRGIGKSTAECFASYGAKVVISDMDADVCEQTTAELKSAGCDVIGVVANITKEEDVAKLMKAPIDKWGKIDCLVNNAGITKDTLFIRMKLEQWRLVQEVIVTGTYLCCKEAVNYMRKLRTGNIINISSFVRNGNVGQVNYSSAKAALIGLTRTLAKELGSMGIRANCVAPGFIETRMTDTVPEKMVEDLKKMISLKRMGLPKDVANAILFLSSDMSSYITGETLEVNGGL